ncbi:hypothetical protein J5J83_19750 [Azoarcus sp. L1K30]|uniref:hypothetical protein n=1 Tax=Azoarcus sp. L1K30 TaxID=2820277 RepID=UPI001B8273B6|nr:hypothetical protein [Azoarcus sp. L1K30]MBR0568362.1 hypothetical protein [Azoarcus sp. L1K30]
MALGMTYSGGFGPTYNWGGGGGTLLTGASGSSSSNLGGFATSLGGALSISGAVTSMIGSYYSAKSAQSAANFQAASAKSAMQFQGQLGELNAAHMQTMYANSNAKSALALDQGKLAGEQNTLALQYQMETNKLSLDYQASVAESNARLRELQAQSAMLQGERQEQSVRLNTSRIKSRQRVSMAASGVDLGGDSAVNLLTTTDVMGEIDAIMVQSNAARAAWGYRTEAVNDTNQAAFARASASTINPADAARLAGPAPIDPNVIAADYSSMYALYKAPTIPYMPGGSAISPIGSAFTSLLGSASSIAGQWYQFQRNS